MWWGFWGRDEEDGEREWRLWGGSDGEGDGDRGRLKRKGLVGFEEEGVVLEGSSGAEAMVIVWVGRFLMDNALCHAV